MKRFRILLKNEMKLSIRDMNMVIFAVLMPLAILIILGMLNGGRTAGPEAAYTFMEQSFGALCAVSMCAGGLMGLPLVVADYRERKILKRFQVTPASPALLLGVELTVYVVYCLISLATLGIASALIWNVRLHGSLPAFLGSWLLTMFSTLSIGMLVGGIAKNSKQAGVIASLLYFPMLVFSGTTVPMEFMPERLQKVISMFPLTQGIILMKSTFLGITESSPLVPVLVMFGVTAVCTGAAIRFFRWE